MQPITTPLTKQLSKSTICLASAFILMIGLDVSSPIVLAPMAFGAEADMAAIVTGTGGFGVFPAGFDSSEKIKANFAAIRQHLSIENEAVVPVGIGFIGWILDITEASDDPRLPAALAEKPQAIWFAFGVDLGKYIRQVREYDAQRADGHKTLIFIIVNSVEDALRAGNEWGVDILVVQGTEAGGHGGSESPPLFLLLPEILAAFPTNQRPHIIAAGGVATGAQVAALLTLGASGVAIGTRFLYTHESLYTPAMKEELVKAGWGATARGFMFDEVNRTMVWPPKHNGRAIANDIVKDFEGGSSLEERMKRHDESAKNGEPNRLVIWAGVGVGLTKEIKSTREVFKELHDDAVKTLRDNSTLLDP